MGKYTEKAVEFFNGGCCCSQSVVSAFADKLGEDAEKLKEASVMYRGGKKVICGAAMGAMAVANYMHGVKDIEDPAKSAPETKELTAMIQQRFRDKIGEDQCREIKGKKLRSCAGCVEDAAAILEQLINEGKI